MNKTNIRWYKEPLFRWAMWPISLIFLHIMIMFIFNFWEYENHFSKLFLYHTVRFFFFLTFFKHFLTRKIFYALLDKKHKSLHQKTWILKKLTILWYVLQKSLCYNNKHWHSCVACCGKTETWAAASTYFIKEEITFYLH